MGEIVNLRQARKARARIEREQDAAANRAKFGLSRADRQALSRLEAERMRQLDGHRLTPAACDDE